MQTRSLILAALVALAASGCETTPDSSDDPADRNRNTDASADASRSPSDPNDSLHDRVHDALMEQMGPRVNDVGVSVSGSTVTLTGSVKTEADRKQAHDIAHGVRGATTVDISALAVKP